MRDFYEYKGDCEISRMVKCFFLILQVLQLNLNYAFISFIQDFTIFRVKCVKLLNLN